MEKPKCSIAGRVGGERTAEGWLPFRPLLPFAAAWLIVGWYGAQQAAAQAPPVPLFVPQTATGTATKVEEKTEEEPAPAVVRGEPAVEEVQEVQRDIPVDGRIVRNLGTWLPHNRKTERPPGLWQFYMHGVADHFAAHIGWRDLFGGGQRPGQWLDPSAAGIKNPFKESPVPALKLGPGTSFAPAKPVPIKLGLYAGQTLRFFVWVRGENAGLPDDCWYGPPGMDVILSNASGEPIHESVSRIKTQGTFPWHCYYCDVAIPAGPVGGSPAAGAEGDAAAGDSGASAGVATGVSVRFTNPGRGTAWFSTLSWEPVGPGNTYTDNEKQDPLTGSLAFNTRFDELPYHLRWGRGTAYQWQFFVGDRSLVSGQPYNLTTVAGVRQYFEQRASKDPQHLVHGIAPLADWYHVGNQLLLLPAFEENWASGVAEVVLSGQDAATGFWGAGMFPRSMAVTWHIVNGLFGEVRIPRTDREDVQTPWLSLDGAKLPHVGRIIDTVLDMQVTYEVNGQRVKAGWSLDCYHFLDKRLRGKRAENRCSLVTTSNAVGLLRMLCRSAGRGDQNRVEDAIKQALRYVLDHCVTPEGLWKQNDTDKVVTTSQFLPQLIDRSPFLERRVSAVLGGPLVSASAVVNGECTLTWESPSEEHASVRIYAVPEDTHLAEMNEAHLVGCIQRVGTTLTQMDPLIVVEAFRQASWMRWQLQWDCLGPSAYTQWKLSLLQRPLPISVNAQPLRVRIVDASSKAVYVTGVNWYGEESRPERVNITVEQAAFGAEGAAGADGQTGTAEGGKSAETPGDGAGAPGEAE